jgi:spermidine/putrescine-binding protein
MLKAHNSNPALLAAADRPHRMLQGVNFLQRQVSLPPDMSTNLKVRSQRIAYEGLQEAEKASTARAQVRVFSGRDHTHALKAADVCAVVGWSGDLLSSQPYYTALVDT